MPIDNQSELFVWVDETDHELGTITRGEAHNGSRKIHRAVTVLVFSQDNSKLLFQQRSLYKDTNPGKWSCGVGGHLNKGDSYETAAKRELFEELGVECNVFRFVMQFLDEAETEREMSYVYEVTIDESVTLNIDKTEVKAIQWCEVSKLNKFLSNHSLTPDTIKILSMNDLI